MGNDSVAEKIKTAREKAGLTQAQLAEKSRHYITEHQPI